MNLNRMNTAPLRVPRSNRNHSITVLTSLPAGKMVPIVAAPMLREDSLNAGRVQIAFEMMETAEILLNPVKVSVKAYLVPHLVFDRFQGSMDQLNRSYKGEPQVDGGSVVDFLETAPMPAPGAHALFKHLGLHAPEGAQINTAYTEAYNAIWNMRAKNRSPKIEQRNRLDTTLAPAFWDHSRYSHIVPDFDQAVIDGEIALELNQERMNVKGLYLAGTANARTPSYPLARHTDGVTIGTENALAVNPVGSAGNQQMVVNADAAGFPEVYTEMAAGGIRVSLANIELAKKTAAYARLRAQYAEHDEQWIIDMLMDGLSIPDQALKQPMLISQGEAVFGQSLRYATDSGNLNESATNGATVVTLNLNTPRIATGGVVMIVAEIVPEQLFERQQDPYMMSQNIDLWPEYLRDALDPEKVEVVRNDYIDVVHNAPGQTFGYAPMNHKWNIVAARVGGKFLRPTVDAPFDEVRQRLWACEVANPKLAEDFYLCTSIHQKPFLVTNADPFEAVALGNLVFTGNTQFGPVLLEAGEDYLKIAEKVDTVRVDQGDPIA